VYVALIQTLSADETVASAADITDVCRQNLIKHISLVQDGIDERLALIEKQVTGIYVPLLMYLYTPVCKLGRSMFLETINVV